MYVYLDVYICECVCVCRWLACSKTGNSWHHSKYKHLEGMVLNVCACVCVAMCTHLRECVCSAGKEKLVVYLF